MTSKDKKATFNTLAGSNTLISLIPLTDAEIEKRNKELLTRELELMKRWLLPKRYEPFDAQGNVDTQQIEQIKKDLETQEGIVFIKFPKIPRKQEQALRDKLDELLGQPSIKGRPFFIDDSEIIEDRSTPHFMGHPTAPFKKLDDLPKTISDWLKPPGR